MTTAEIRSKYLEFFKKKQHVIVPSSSLVPENDATTLFTGSGMQPMVPFLLGAPHPEGKRLADSQKSFRSQDIEEVGDNRHTTFFEMLGNWSLGDYFKQDQIPWMFEFLTKELGLNPQNLYVTCFRGNSDLNIPKDTESAELWQKLFSEAGINSDIVDFAEKNGMQGGRIFYYDEKKNWWSRSGVPQNMPEGEPGGPDSEMFWDFGAELNLHEQSEWKDLACHVNCDCGRFLEIGNNVFMEYVKVENGFEKLKQQNVDFGGGLERMAASLNNDPDIFKIDLFAEIVRTLENTSGKKYLESAEITKAFRVISDHVRASVFLVNDGIEPSNKDRGYVLRRLLRRSIVYAKQLELTGDWLKELVTHVVNEYAASYPDLKTNEAKIVSVITAEEKKFTATLAKGLKEFEKLFAAQNALSGTDAFNLYQTYGFPWEITHELVTKKGSEVSSAEFEAEFKKHQDLSRTASAGDFKGGLASHSEKIVKLHTATHLMQKALRVVLGDHVWQKGSNITEERTRFDFTHPEKMTDEQKQKVEDLVNGWIQQDLVVNPENMSLEKARELGAIGLFGEKYGDTVSVYTISNPSSGEVVSREFCGGPHVEHTGVIGKFKILKEEAVSAGVRRIKASIQ